MNKFPKIKQPSTKSWCVPACIQNVFEYYNVKYYNQKLILKLFEKYRKDPYYFFYQY